MSETKTPRTNAAKRLYHSRTLNAESYEYVYVDFARQLETELSEAVKLNSNEHGIFDPDYARVFTQARIIAWQYGYACLAHGSFTRDLDLLLVPWTENASVPITALINRIADVAGLKLQGEPSNKPHGRKSWSLLFPAFNDPRWVDISAFEPSKTDDQLKKELEAQKQKFKDLNKELGCELRDPNGTIWEHCAWLQSKLSTITKAGDEFDRWLGRAHIRYNAGECQRCKAHAEWQRVKKESGL